MLLAAEGVAAEAAIANEVEIGDDEEERRDWVTREEDAFIGARPHLQRMADMGLRRSIALMAARIRAKRLEGALSFADFTIAVESDSDGDSIVALLRRNGTLSRGKSGTKFCVADLHLFYLNHRWTAADELLAKKFGSAEGRAALAKIRDDCKELARELRWLLDISEAFDSHEMPDEMRRLIRRAAGSEAQAVGERGWLQWVAGWVNEAAFKLERDRPPSKADKETAFMLDWFTEASARSPRSDDVVWEVGRRMFLLTFPAPKNRYLDVDDYRRVVKRRQRQLRAAHRN